MRDTWDLSQMYKTKEEFYSDLEKLDGFISRLSSFEGNLKLADKKVLLDYFKLDSEFSILFEKLAVYAHCKKDDDGKNAENLKMFAQISDRFSVAGEKLAFAKTELSQIDDLILNQYLQDNDFSDFSREIEFIIRAKKHTLPIKDEIFVSKVRGFSNFDDAFDMLSDIEMEHGSFVDEKGKEIKLSTGNYNFYMKNPHQDVRKRVSQNYLGEYKKLNQTFSSLFISHVKYVNFLAKIYGYDSALDMMTYEEEVSPEIMLKNIEFVSGKFALLQDYFRLKKKLLNLDEFLSCDISAVLDTNAKIESFEEATKDIYDSFFPLGKDYQEMFKKSLDEGWIDALPRDTKSSGGYTISAFASHPYILLNFDGTAYWKSAIAHEFGHAMHSYYSALNQPYAKSEYTIFVAEVASLTNEILFTNFMLQKETNKVRKMQILMDFLQLFYLNVFNSSVQAKFELFVHDKLFEGESLTASDLNEKYKSLFEDCFGDSVKLTDNFEFGWQRISHFYRDYYLYKYSTGFICACAVSSNILGDKTGEYVKCYKEFLKLGGSLDPVSSLKVAKIDILSEETYNQAFAMFENYLKELKKLYEEKN